MSETTRNELLLRIADEKVIAIIRGVKPLRIVEVGNALLAGGLSMMEVTFDHAGENGIAETLESLALLRDALGGKVAVGAGTVLTGDEVEDAARAGAGYIISPNFDPAVVAKTRELGLLSLPGAFTPTEIVAAHRAGGDIVKVFPAVIGGAQGGVEYLKAVRGPLAHIPLAAVGGVDTGNAAAFVRAGAFCLGVGGNLVNAKKVAAGDFASIAAAAKEFRTLLA